VKQDLWRGRYREPAVWVETAQALIAATELRPGMRVLDIGSAGGGTLFPALDRIGPTGSIVGIEVEEDWVAWLQKEISKRAIENVENLLMDGRSMSFPAASFDAVILGLVGLDTDYDFDSDRILNDAPLMRETFRVLKPGGNLYTSNWLRQEDNDWMAELIRRRLPDCAKRGYFAGTGEGYVRLLESTGFEEIRLRQFEGRYTYESPAEWAACVACMWEEEVERIKADPETLDSFERDAFGLLAGHVDSEGRIAYTRSAIIVTAQRPLA